MQDLLPQGLSGSEDDEDVDGDGVVDELDNCPEIENPDQFNRDGDRYGDACDDDLDGDGFENEIDNCVMIYNDPQSNLDGDEVPVSSVCAKK